MATSTTRKSLSLFWRYTKRYAPLFWAGTIGSVLGVVTQDIIPPFIVSRAFDRLQTGFGTGEDFAFKDFQLYFVFYAVSMLVGFAVWRLQSYCVWRFEIAIRRDLAQDIYNHLQSQSQRFHADRFGGSLVSQTNKLIGAYERVMDDFIWNVVPSVTTVLFALGLLFFISMQYALILLAISIVYLLIMSRRMRKQMPFNRDEAAKESKQTAALADAITNMSTIRAFGVEKYESKRFADVTSTTYDSSNRLAWEALKTDSMSHFMTNGFHIVAFFFGLIAITNFDVNVGVLYLVVSYTGSIVNRLWQFGRLMRNQSRAFGDATEMTEILDIKPEVVDTAKPLEPAINRGTIEFKNVTFTYLDKSKNKTPLFKGLNLKIKPGEKIGLVGHSGGGKTTITRLILRFADIQKGKILIDGQDIAGLRQSDLRSHIAYVPQEPMLFHRSLAENIAYAKPSASQEEIIAIAKMAHAHEFMEQLSDGYNTLVGERGVKLSGGQRQRVAIARAMLKNAPILVLDEATSALDSESEVLIQDALWKLMEGKTALVIAHRLSTVQKMDRILVMDKGKIVEEGTHKELLRHNGIYAKLWNHQSGGFLEE
jgi:ATP-binding cassette, subfamily B, bacterial